MARSTTTSSTGRYQFGALEPGSYVLSFSRSGFQTETRGVELSAASETLDVVLKVGVVSTTVEVTDIASTPTGSRMEIPDQELPVQISSVPQQVLEEQGANDLVTALRNASGVSAQRFYGIYEYYTLRGFNQADVELVNGMRLEGNRFNTQLNSVQEVQVLKGPSSILYGGQALGGAINIIRKQPQPASAYELSYREGRFQRHQVEGGATGPILGKNLLYRVDASLDHTDGWRGAGAERLNLSPSITWTLNPKTRVTVEQTFNRDHFDGDGGLPVALASLPGFDLRTRFSTPSDFGLIKDSQTQVLFRSALTPSWEFRDGFFARRTGDQYFVTEGLTYNPSLNEVDRYALYFKHHRRPLQNQADLIGHVKLLATDHTLLAGYEYEDFYNFTHRTADGGDFFPPPISLATLQETQPPITTFPIASVDYFTNRTHAFYWQDQVSLTERLFINVGGRYDRWRRISRTDPWANGAAVGRGPDRQTSQTAYTYRAGVVYALPASQQVYFSSSSSFQPVNTIPTSGPELKPETGQSYEVGYRWQALNGRINTSLAFYKIVRNDVVIARGGGRFDQAGQQSSRGVDLDINGEIRPGLRLLGSYGYTLPRFDNFLVSNGTVDLSGNRPRFVPLHTANLWLTKLWDSVSASVGMRYVGPMFTNNDNSIRLGGWTTFSGAVGYRQGLWELSLNAENLLNRQRYFTGADYEDQVYPGPPINVFMTVRLHFR